MSEDKSYWRETDFFLQNRNKTSWISRKFHNHVKWLIIQKYVKKGDFVLELAAGRGVDVYKHKKAGARFVFYVDKDRKAMTFFQQRYHQSLFSKDFEMFFALKNMTNLTSCLQLGCKRKHLFDIVSCQMALHYFFETKQTFYSLFSLVDSALKQRGFFVVSTMDAEMVQKYFKDKVMQTQISALAEIEILPDFCVQKCREKKNFFGHSVAVNVTSIGRKHTEFLVDFDGFLIPWMRKKGYHAVSDTKFDTFACDFENSKQNINLDFASWAFSCLYRMVVFVKG
jgi:hypothetical protein